MIDWTARAEGAANAVRQRSALVPRVGLILGSGLGDAANAVVVDTAIETAAIPYFPRSTVPGHAGRLILGWLAGRPVAVLAGRVHGYEGYPAAEVAFAPRLLGALGCRTLIVTNAAGSLNPTFRPGDLMLVEDHISFPSLAGFSPLAGHPPGDLPRFVDLTDAYSRRLRELAEDVARDIGLQPRVGVYVMVAGPNFETPAEVRFLRSIGGDAVGMSTAPEVIVARQLGIEVLGLSVISNLAAGLPGALLRHEDVLASVSGAVLSVTRLVIGVLSRLPE
ncbi:MAG: purine-nucleoside phosphorylase [Chloroflexota bacterium]